MRRVTLAKRSLKLAPATALVVMMSTATVAEGAGTLPSGTAGNPAPPAVTATFDGFSEGFSSPVLTDGGITFFGLDRRVPDDPPDPGFIIESTTSLSHLPGFTPSNVLGFGGYAPGPGVAFARIGEFRLTTGRPETEANLNFYGFADQSSTVLTLEASYNGVVVGSDSTNLAGEGGVIAHWALQVSGVLFDELRVVSSGPVNEGTAFLAADTVTIGNQALPPVGGCGATAHVYEDADDCELPIDLQTPLLEQPLSIVGRAFVSVSATTASPWLSGA